MGVTLVIQRANTATLTVVATNTATLTVDGEIRVPSVAENVTPPALGVTPVVGTALAYTAGVWTYETSVSVQAQRRLLAGAWADVGSAWDSIVGTPYVPVHADAFYTFQVIETATPGAVTANSNETGQTTGAMTFQVTTTAPSQTLTIAAMTVSASVNINWGDASSNNYTGSGSRTHVYASAGTYTVTLDLPLLVTLWQFSDNKISGATGSKFSYMRNLTSLLLANFGANFAWTVGASAPMPTGLTYLYLNNLVTNFAWTVGASAPMPTGLTFLLLTTLSPGLVFDASFAFGLPLTTLRIESALSQAQVDLVLEQLYAVFPTRTGTNGTIDLLGGSNAAPSGILQAACAPTTGNEFAYELVNDSCAVSAKHWAAVTVQTYGAEWHT